MIEMRVREVQRCEETGRPIAILERSGDGAPAELSLPVDSAEGHALMHELRRQRTLRSHSFRLMARVLAGLKGRVSAVEIVPDEKGTPRGQLRVVGPERELRVALCTGQALGLAVSLRLPLLVAESLLSTDSAAEPSEPPVTVPDVFLRAFGG